MSQANSNANSTHNRNALNNYAQKAGYTLKYDDACAGPQQAPTWTSTVTLNGTLYGTGQGITKAAAQEVAAGAALAYLSQRG
ncbi:hypothetical protein PM082_003503 [Marasmius tenuissimus]|nr:hypothetical protein PM082_003503 [Marasmius tenuissimus]